MFKGMVVYQCEQCHEGFHYRDEMTFYSGEVEVEVSESSPDYSHALCVECEHEQRRKAACTCENTRAQFFQDHGCCEACFIM